MQAAGTIRGLSLASPARRAKLHRDPLPWTVPRASALASGKPTGAVDRRQAIKLPVAALVLGAGHSWAQPRRVLADEGLPKQYAKLAPKLVDALLESLDLEEQGAGEFQVRRKADEAKPLVKEFVAKWKADPRLTGEKSQAEIKEAIRELADFYMKNGQRAAVPRNVVASIRGHLLAAKSVLPEPEKKNFLGF